MARFNTLIKTIKMRFSKKKMNQRIRPQLSYEEIIRRYEELSTN